MVRWCLVSLDAIPKLGACQGTQERWELHPRYLPSLVWVVSGFNVLWI